MERLARTTVLAVVACACIMSASNALFAASPKDEPPQYCTVFTHFAKSGGSTVKNQLSQSCTKEGAHPPGLITADARTTRLGRLDAVNNATIIVGPAEMVRETLKAVGRDCEYFTMLRDPIERLVSAFYYCPTDHDVQGRPSKWCGDSQGESEAIEDRLLDFATHKWSNSAFLVMMNSILCDPRFEFCDPQNARDISQKPHNVNTMEGWLLHNEIKKILSTYTAVGIFEERELSMKLYNAKVTSPVRDWDAGLMVNPGKQSPAREELLNWAHASPELHNALAADILLYDYAVSLFRQQTRVALGTEWY